MYLILDNFDSFVYTIHAYIEEIGRQVMTRRVDTVTLDEIKALNPTGIILSPGPKRPEDAALCIDTVRTFGTTIPILGVCLGFQVLAYTAGATVTKGPLPMHGKVTPITHNGTGLFRGLPQHLKVTRYHSLALARQTLPAAYQVDATSDDGIVMAISHRTYPLYGVQFHPEAVRTEHGHDMLRNFCAIAEEKELISSHDK